MTPDDAINSNNIKSSVIKNYKQIFMPAVVAAALCFDIYFMTVMQSYINHYKLISEATAINAVVDYVKAVIIFFPLLALVCFCIAALPFCLALSVVRKFKIKSFMFWVVGGVVLGILSTPLFLMIPHMAPEADALNISWYEEFVTMLPGVFLAFVLSGLAGGVVAAWRSKNFL